MTTNQGVACSNHAGCTTYKLIVDKKLTANKAGCKSPAFVLMGTFGEPGPVLQILSPIYTIYNVVVCYAERKFVCYRATSLFYLGKRYRFFLRIFILLLTSRYKKRMQSGQAKIAPVGYRLDLGGCIVAQDLAISSFFLGSSTILACA